MRPNFFLAGKSTALGIIIAIIGGSGIFESKAQSFPPMPEVVWLLNSYRFNDTNLFSAYGDGPRVVQNVQSVESFETNAVRLAGPGPSFLQYNFVETNRLATNISLTRGLAMMWYRPLADTSEMSSNVLTFIQLGSYGDSNGWWSLYAFSNTIFFAGASNNQAAVFLEYGPVVFPSNQFTHVALNYSLTNSALYLNGQQVTNGGGVLYWPNEDYLFTNGISLGCNSAGSNLVNGDLDVVRFYSGWGYDNMISAHYSNMVARYGGGFFGYSGPSQGGAEILLGSMPGIDFSATNIYGGITSNCPNQDVAILVTSINNGVLSMTICNAETNQFDLFCITDLNLLTNLTSEGSWYYLGRTSPGQNLIEVTNLPSSQCFFRLGTMQDSDGDGLTDAFENLVSKTSASDPDYDGDGLADGYEWFISHDSVFSPQAVPTLRDRNISKCPIP